MIASLKAAGEATRLRILVLLDQAELSVKDLTAILGQSQPRISRHLKLLAEAGLIDRYPEGAWVFYRLAESGGGARLIRDLLALIDRNDPSLARDRDRLADVKREHADTAHRYFAANAGDWDTIRALHVAEDRVEAAVLKALGCRHFRNLLDLGTGTGRMLDLLAPFYDRAVGIDASPNMLAVARANLDRAGIANAQVRLGDIYNLPLPRDAFDVVTIHQVLHYLDEPERALGEAARVLRPGGRMLIVDFAPPELEFLREEHAHRRLGFAEEQVRQWIETRGLELERVVDLPGQRNKLKVTMWLARDPRIVVADAAQREVA
jgi:ArsR family transcriptional regulator